MDNENNKSGKKWVKKLATRYNNNPGAFGESGIPGFPQSFEAIAAVARSNSMVATGFSLMSRRRRLTPYTVMMDGTFDYYDNEGISCRLPF